MSQMHAVKVVILLPSFAAKTMFGCNLQRTHPYILLLYGICTFTKLVFIIKQSIRTLTSLMNQEELIRNSNDLRRRVASFVC